MPATEQTWRDLKLMHVVFGFSALIMLVSTIWMFADDHNREWKGYQRKFRNAEQKLTKWQIQDQQSSDKRRELDELTAQILEAQLSPPERSLLAAFKSEVEYDAEQRSQPAPDFSSIDQTYERLIELCAQALAAHEELAAFDREVSQAWEQVAVAKAAVESAGIDREALRQANAALKEATREHESQLRKSNALVQSAMELSETAVTTRDDLMQQLARIMESARGREDRLAIRRKVQAADLDKAKANLDLMVRDSRSLEDRAAQQALIDELRSGADGLDELTLARQAATQHRQNLQQIYAAMNSERDRLAGQLHESRAEYERLVSSFAEKKVTYFDPFPLPGKKWLELAILDAFNSPLKIDNYWTDGLTLKYGSFNEVRRFDRCTTCHRGIDKSAPGSASDPAYLAMQTLTVVLQTPDAPPEPADPAVGLTLQDVYGFQVAPDGLFSHNETTINHVSDRSLAAMARVSTDNPHLQPSQGLQVGDVVLFVNDAKVLSPAEAQQFMITGARFGEPLSLTIRRGLPQPFTSHPRLDLFVGSLSPHPLAEFGCTSCHEGQGSGTSFAYASHTPNSSDQAKEWARQHGWFANHHWILPMFPRRHAEAACLRCHHDVAELEPSERFPDPPAPTLVKGWHLVNDFGCFGCHEISGYGGPDKRIGPDMRLEPNYFAAAASVKADPGFEQLDRDVRSWAETLVAAPYRDDMRHQLASFLRQDARSDAPQLSTRSHEMWGVLQDVETPGTLRKVGPSLRYVKDKVSSEFMLDWIRVPTHFRPTTRMPQFFGLWDHLEESDRQLTESYERAELHAMVAYLLDRSEPFRYDELEPGTEAASVERGKISFEVRGCLACHSHQDFPGIAADQGPDLSNIGDKMALQSGGADGFRWLYTWLKNPSTYHARTSMPDLLLDPERNVDGDLIDPAADIATYLMQSRSGWQPDEQALTPFSEEALDAVIREYLTAAFPIRDAEDYIVNGIPESIGSTLVGDEIELVGNASEHQKLMYLGRKTISKYGCHACHDIPGFEAAKPIGTALADWGIKEPSMLAFEHIAEYLHHGHGHGGKPGADHRAAADRGAHPTGDGGMAQPPGASDHAADAAAIAADEAFYLQRLAMNDRAGFIWQKLRQPRSYDFEKTGNKKYSERLLMPKFNFDVHQREAVITFVLGLVATPPAEKFVYRAEPRRRALAEGLTVIQKYNCAGCHLLDTEQWTLEFEPGQFDDPGNPPDFPFLAHAFTSEDFAISQTPNARRGTLSATLRGMPALNNDNGETMIWDEDWEPIEPDDLPEYSEDELFYPMQLWQPALIDGSVHEVGRPLGIPSTAIKQRRPPHGGDFAIYLLPRVTALEKLSNPNANATESWGWVPPPLMGEGAKVEPGWLHGFLLEPYPLRPSVFLRMPKFNMSPDEATKLVNYFAARDNVDYPFEYDSRKHSTYLASANAPIGDGETSRLDSAMQIVTKTDYCVQCHLVADFVPQGSVRALAPNLAYSQSRLRPEFMRRWMANPVKMLPYTPMPKNIPFDPDSPHLGGVDQSIFPGTSIEQIDGLVDLLSNFGAYMTQKSRVADLVRESAPAGETTSSEPGGE